MRTTTDPKESTIKVRINESTRELINNKTQTQGISISEYIRDLINKDLAKDK